MQQIVSEQTKMALMQEDIKNLKTTIAKIMDNHLPHIQAGIDELHDKIDELSEKIGKTKEEASKEIYDVRISMARYVGIGIGVVAVLQLLMKYAK